MLDFHQRRKLRLILFHPAIRVGLLIIFFFIAYSAYIRYEIAREMRERREIAEFEASVLEEQKLRLEEEVEYLSTERGIEAEMRRQFDIALPGEEVVVIIDESTSTDTIEPTPADTEDIPWYQFWR